MSKNQTLSIQEQILDYFKEYDDQTISHFIDSFVYYKPAYNDQISKLVEKFLEDNGITEAYLNYVSDARGDNDFFKRASGSQVDTINIVNQALLNLVYNRFRNNLIDKSKLNEIDKKVIKLNKKNFNLLKKSLLECYDCLNRNENYFYSKEEDKDLVDKISQIKFVDND